MKKLLLLFLGFFIGFSINAQTTEVVGKGMNNSLSQNLLLNDDDLNDIDSVMLVVTYKGTTQNNGNILIWDSDEADTCKFEQAVIHTGDSSDHYPYTGFFKTTFYSIDSAGVNAEVLYPADSSSVQSFYAVIYFSDKDSFNYGVADVQNVFIYNTGPDDPYVYKLPLTKTFYSKDVKITVPVSGLNSEYKDRNAVIKVTAGNMRDSMVVSDNNKGDFFNIEDLELKDVDGSVDTVYVGVYSPLTTDKGGSFITGGAFVDVDLKECGECEGQITSLDLQYLGNETDATIKIYSGKVKHGKPLAVFTGVNYGDTLSFTGDPDRDYKMGAKIRLILNDGDAYTEIHTSCSQPIYVGMIKGDYLIIGGTSHEGGPLCENPDYEEGECGECDGGITSLSLEYLGEEDSVTIKVYSKKGHEQILLGTFDDVNTGDTISFTGNNCKDGKMGPEIKIYVNDSTVTSIHTSCSQPIYVGMVYDDLFEITAGMSRNGGPLCEVPDYEEGECGECDGGITSLSLEYLGEEDSVSIRVYSRKGPKEILLATFDKVNTGDTISFTGNNCKDGKMGPEIKIYVNDSTVTSIHTSCSQPIYVGMVYDDLFEITAGMSRYGGPLCEVPDYEEGECGECDGGITSLSLEYLGEADSVSIKVYSKKGHEQILLATFDEVSTGDTISFTGMNCKDGKMGPEIKIYVNDSTGYTSIHTSCSQPILIGMVYNELFRITAGTSKYGGPLCDNQTTLNSERVQEGQELMVFPNPLTNSGTIEFITSEDGLTTVELFDMSGNKVAVLFNDYVQSNVRYKVQLNANDLKKGLYIVFLKNGSKVYRQKLSVFR